MGQTAPGTGTGAPTLTPHAEGLGFTLGDSQVQSFKGFTFVTPQDSMNKVADVCRI